LLFNFVMIRNRRVGAYISFLKRSCVIKVTILGSGPGISNGGDHFDWMDSWQIYFKGCEAAGPVKQRSRSFAGTCSSSACEERGGFDT